MANTSIVEYMNVSGYEGYYQVSNLGKVRSVTRYVCRSRGGKQILVGRLLRNSKSGPAQSTYYSVALSKKGKATTKRVHRLVAETFLPNNKGKAEVNHINGNKLDNRLSNLEWCTSKENKQHAMKTGLNKNIGEGHYAHKLCEKSVRDIRATYVPYEYTIAMIADEYGVSKGTVQDVLENSTWRSI